MCFPTFKKPKKAKKAKCDGPTDGRTDGQTDTVTYRVACTRLKIKRQIFKNS